MVLTVTIEPLYNKSIPHARVHVHRPPSSQQYMNTPRVLLSLLTTGSWYRFADVCRGKPVMLISMIGTTISHLAFVQAEFIPKDFRVYVGGIALPETL